MQEDPADLIERVEVFLKNGRDDPAAETLRSLLAREQLSEAQLRKLAHLAHQLRRPDLECRALERATVGGLQSFPLRTRLVDLWLALSRTGPARHLAETLAKERPNDDAVLLRLARALEACGDYEEAARVLADRLHKGPADTALALAWGRAVIDGLRDPTRALADLRAYPEGALAAWIRRFLEGRALADLGRPRDALAALQDASELAPDQALVWFERGALHRRFGNGPDSADAFRRCLALDPKHAEALRVFGYDHRFQRDDREWALVRDALVRVREFAPAAQVNIFYAAAKAFEDVGDIDTAFSHYVQAGALFKTLHPWSPDGLGRLRAALQQAMTRERCAALSREGYASELPVFIIGMPRSGTTLIEQVLASHRNVSSVGEVTLAEDVLNGVKIGGRVLETTRARHRSVVLLQETLSLAQRGERYLSQIKQGAPPGAARLIDKMPGNSVWAGLIHAMLPGARFIHCRRHPLDTCLSMFKLHFGGGVPYSYDLDDLGAAYRVHWDLMRHWREVIPQGRLVEVHYETVVRDLEGEARRLVSFLGLPWDEACLAFHDRGAAVRTASATQVRRPVHTGAIGSWRRFEKHLQPLLDKIGDLVVAYESELDGAISGRHI